MSLPALIAELFVGGVLCLVWLALLLGIFVDLTPLLTFVTQNQALGALLVSVAAYVLGVVLDRLWDSLLKPFDERSERAHFPDKERLRSARQRIFGKEKDGSDFVNYIRSRMRVARAAFCNSILICYSAMAYYAWGILGSSIAIFVALGLLGLFFVAISFIASRSLAETYYRSLLIFYVSEQPNKAPEPTTTAVTSPAAQEPRKP